MNLLPLLPFTPASHHHSPRPSTISPLSYITTTTTSCHHHWQLSEASLQKELDQLRQEKTSRDLVLRNLEAIQNNLKRSEFEMKASLTQRLEVLEQENVSLRRKIDGSDDKQKSFVFSLEVGYVPGGVGSWCVLVGWWVVVCACGLVGCGVCLWVGGLLCVCGLVGCGVCLWVVVCACGLVGCGVCLWVGGLGCVLVGWWVGVCVCGLVGCGVCLWVVVCVGVLVGCGVCWWVDRLWCVLVGWCVGGLVGCGVCWWVGGLWCVLVGWWVELNFMFLCGVVLRMCRWRDFVTYVIWLWCYLGVNGMYICCNAVWYY